jgi:hypothetical protein
VKRAFGIPIGYSGDLKLFISRREVTPGNYPKLVNRAIQNLTVQIEIPRSQALQLSTISTPDGQDYPFLSFSPPDSALLSSVAAELYGISEECHRDSILLRAFTGSARFRRFREL